MEFGRGLWRERFSIWIGSYVWIEWKCRGEGGGKRIVVGFFLVKSKIIKGWVFAIVSV